MARDRTRKKKLISWDERLDQICQIMELARKYKVPVNYHVGIPIGSAGHIDMARSRAHAEMADNGNPLLCHEVASLYPDVPIVMSHGGVEASGYYLDDYEKCLNVAASHKNVFLETGQWWAELYDKPLLDPNIGAKKLVWGCGWGQGNLTQHWMPGHVPTTYNASYLYNGPATHQPDIYGWSLRELGRLQIPQDDMNLILGGNAAWIYKIDTPLPYKRLFKNVDRGFGQG
jgi:predicted TIM-barrel fold metal-dependent hydrolase